MENIQVSARLKIKAGKMEAFREIEKSCVEVVKQEDEGTLQYDWFYNRKKNECIVLERYIDSDALLNHIDHVGHLLGGLVNLSNISLDIYGNASEKLKNALEGFDVSYYDFGNGIN